MHHIPLHFIHDFLVSGYRGVEEVGILNCKIKYKN